MWRLVIQVKIYFKYTIKDGIVYDAKALLEDVRKQVEAAKKAEGFQIRQPGMERD